MYRILLVDDEMPALRFLQAIIGKYAPDFSVCASYTNGAAALEYLGKYPVDLLITDISMDGMNGIELAQAAREARPDIHILILSGYSEFEYAQGAIRAAVDDYILKPVPIPQITKALKTIREKLDEEAGAKGPALLSALFSGAPFDENLLERLYGGAKYHFALVRWGNLRLLQPPLTGTAAVPLTDAPFSALYGRDDDEQILFMSARTPAGEFQQAVKAYVAQRKPTAWTILFSRRPEPFREIAGFFGRAARQMEKTVVVGRRQFAFLGQSDRQECPRIPAATLKKLDLFMQGGDLKMVKVNFLSLAVDWEKRQVPQLYVYTMVQQIVNLALASRPTLATRQDAVFRDVDELMKYASSYGELMAGLYTVLFDENALHDKKLTAEDLYACAVRYVREKYAQPISIQHVCAEVGISQTYLSRLFRKFGSTSFNSFLTRCRMESAMSMIRENADLPLRSIAACVGYDDYAYFSKVFHQYVGCTPSQFASSLKTAPAQP